MVKLSGLVSLLSVPFVVVLMVIALMGCARKPAPLGPRTVTITPSTIVLCSEQPALCK